jgi:hypothetical protein
MKSNATAWVFNDEHESIIDVSFMLYFLELDADDIEYTCNVPVCPYPCTCFNGVVDCKDKDLIEIPRNIPETTIEL